MIQSSKNRCIGKLSLSRLIDKFIGLWMVEKAHQENSQSFERLKETGRLAQRQIFMIGLAILDGQDHG